MSTKYVPLDDIWRRFSSRYEAIMVATREVRRVIDAIRDGQIELSGDPYLYVLQKIAQGELPAPAAPAKEQPVETE